MTHQVTPSRHTLRAQAWLHKGNPDIDFAEFRRRMETIPGNIVLAEHRDCDCIGAQTCGEPDDHLLMMDATREM